MIILVIFSGSISQDRTLIVLFLSAIIIFGLSCLGISAGCTKNNTALKLFAGFMVPSMIIALSAGTFLAVIVVNAGNVKDMGMYGVYHYIFTVVLVVFFGFALAALISLLVSLQLLRLHREQDQPSPHLTGALLPELVPESYLCASTPLWSAQ
ncbi:hypothetical protein NL108_000765%2C partial [Scomber scombrus]